MTTEVWLRTNVRALWLGVLLPGAAAGAGALMVLGLPGREPPAWMRLVGGVLAALGALLILALAVQLRRPRLAYADGRLLVWLRSGPPIRVPIECVECFLLGQAPSMLPGKRHRRTEAAALVIRIAESAADWQHVEVKPQLGSWCEGYITIRGTWCEPLGIPLVNRLNRRLAEVTAAAGKRE
jgi:hypothetical protein